MRKSQIFAEFEKIAIEKGLIDPKAPEKAKAILEKNPRWDSKTKEDIEKIYNLHPDTAEGMEYGEKTKHHNIIDLAHPNSLVIAPAYDRLNGLVENENERQNITLHILDKHTRGLHTQHRYAQQELVLALVRTANDLDNKNQKELTLLADICLEQISGKSFKKTAKYNPYGWGAAPVSVLSRLTNPYVLIAGTFAALYLYNHMDDTDNGFEENHKKLVSELDDFLNSNTNFGVGYTYKPDFLKMVSEFKNQLENYYNIYKQCETTIKEIEYPHSGAEVLDFIAKEGNDAPQKAYQKLKEASSSILKYATKIASEFGKESYKARQVEDKGAITSIIDKLQVFHGGKGLVSDDFDDVKMAIPPFLSSLKEISDMLVKAGTIGDAVGKDVSGIQSQKDQIFVNDKDQKSNNNSTMTANIKATDDKAPELTQEMIDELGT